MNNTALTLLILLVLLVLCPFFPADASQDPTAGECRFNKLVDRYLPARDIGATEVFKFPVSLEELRNMVRRGVPAQFLNPPNGSFVIATSNMSGGMTSRESLLYTPHKLGLGYTVKKAVVHGDRVSITDEPRTMTRPVSEIRRAKIREMRKKNRDLKLAKNFGVTEADLEDARQKLARTIPALTPDELTHLAIHYAVAFSPKGNILPAAASHSLHISNAAVIALLNDPDKFPTFKDPTSGHFNTLVWSIYSLRAFPELEAQVDARLEELSRTIK